MRLSDYLAKKRIKPAEFSRSIGVSRASVSRYVAGLRFPEPDVLMKITKATGGVVTANDFLSSIMVSRAKARECEAAE